MATRCFSPIFGKRIRATTLDLCGNPPAPGDPCAYVATDGFISITLSAEVEDGTEIITKKANGDICVNERSADSFKRFTVEIEFCGVNPDLLAIATNAEPYPAWNGDISGITIPEGALTSKFALELWTGLTGQACEPGTEEASGYLLLPFVQSGVLGDLEINGENAISFTMTGAFTKGGNQWGVGPYAVMGNGGIPSSLPLALDPLDHLLLTETDIAPPPSACECQPMPEPPPGVPAVELASIAPETGPEAGGTSVTLTGTGFSEGQV